MSTNPQSASKPSDSDDEVIVARLLCDDTADSGSLPETSVINSSQVRTKGYEMMLNMGYQPGLGLGKQLEGRPEPVPLTYKRKREWAGIGSPSSEQNPGAFQQIQADENFPVPVESKKARKRRRRSERRAAEAASKQTGEADQSNNMPVPTSSSKENANLHLLNVSDASAPDSYHVIQSCVSTHPPQLPHLHEPYSHSNHVGLNAGSTYQAPASWMPPTTQLPIHPLPNFSTSWPPPTRFYHPLPAHPNSHLPARPPQQNTYAASLSKTNTLPSLPPKPHFPIGMQPDPDPFSKHGTFRISLSSQNSNDGTDSKEIYMPNPARTLVMEQLPKSYRSHDFVNAWAYDACGTYPVHIKVDRMFGKALVEFATAELARRAWNSPRLQVHGAKEKFNRIDLIRVWWYRVDGVGADAGVGEIEEGEIEGDGAGKEFVPAVKETKKQRKARLVREREAKAATTSQSLVTTTDNLVIQDSKAASMQPLPSWNTTATSSMKIGSSPLSFTGENLLLGVANKAPSVPSVQPRPIAPTSPIVPPVLGVRRQKMGLGVPAPSAVVIPASESTLDPKDATMGIPESVALSLPRQVTIGLSTSEDQSVSITSSVSSGAVSTSSSPDTTVTSKPMAPSTSSQPLLRTIKDAPTGSTSTRRSLLARQKELEECIAKGKMELEQRLKGTSRNSSSIFSPGEKEPLSQGATDGASKSTLSSLLTTAVKTTKQSDLQNSVVFCEQDKSLISPDSRPPSATEYLTASDSTSMPPDPRPTTPDIAVNADPSRSLDELAVTFITESIQSIKPTTSSTQQRFTPPVLVPSTILELAAKQKLLEQQIAESKMLMAKLGQARTKQERKAILTEMKEKSRTMEADAPTRQMPMPTSFSSQRTARQQWPGNQQEVVVLILSDEEDSDKE